jgi:hypothetical protein
MKNILSNLVLLIAAIIYGAYGEYKCNFSDSMNRRLKFVRDPHDCRVFHICAFNKQFTHECLQGFYFDTLINACNPEHQVDCENKYKTKESYVQLDSYKEIVNDRELYDNHEESTEPIVAETTAEMAIDQVYEWIGPSECIKGFSHRIPHPQNCGKYFECLPSGEKIEYSCTYPMQFDEYYYDCRDYGLVDCGKREEAKDMCDYRPSRPSINSIPCHLYPSCKGLKDDLYPDMIRDCRHYFQCKDERTLFTTFCPQNSTFGGLKFNAYTKKCDSPLRVSYTCGGFSIPIDLKTGEMQCPLNSMINFYAHPSECNVYLSCLNGKLATMQCPNGLFFSGKYQKCVEASMSECLLI